MSRLPRPLASYLDQTLLAPDATAEEVLGVVHEAAARGFAAVFVPPCYVGEAVAALEKSAADGHPAVPVGTAIAFPFGWADPRIRLEEARRAVEQGARELDTVLNVSRLKSGDRGQVEDDLSGWVEALRATEEELVLKVIVETALLTDAEKELAAEIVVESGADYVKTSTGFAAGGATLADVELLVEAVRGRARVKAAGGIRDAETAVAMIEAGVDRIGTSTGVQIVEGWAKLEEG